jgi:peptidoglycan hydrolase-like protein with peptidoglycan-binding domain
VGELQDLLKCLGYFPKEQSSTSQFGSITEQAVKDFQKINGIEQAGYVGPATREELNKYKK